MIKRVFGYVSIFCFPRLRLLFYGLPCLFLDSKVVNVIHNDYYLDVLATLEVFLNVVAASTDVLAAQLSVPLEMKEAVCSICYAAPFLDNSPEMVKIRAMFIAKYRTDEDLLKTNLVHKKVLLGLSHDMPDDALINYYLSNILNEHLPSEAAPVATSTANPSPPTKPSPSPVVAPSAPPQLPTSQSNSPLDIISAQARLSEQQIMGTMRIDSSGHHWVLQDSSSPPSFIPPQHTLNSNEGDIVIVTLDTRKDGKRSGKVFRNLSVEASSTPILAKSAPKPLQLSQSSKSLGMSALAAEHHIGEATGNLVFDSLQHAWVMDPKYPRPIYIPPIGIGTAMPGDSVSVRVFEKGNKLLGKIISSSAPISSTSPPFTIAASSTSISSSLQSHLGPNGFQLRDNPLLQNLVWKHVPLLERRGLFKREDEHFSMVLDEAHPLETPIVVLGDAHRNGAENGDRIKVVVFGQTTNPATNSTIILGQVASILESQPKSVVQTPEAAPKKTSPSPPLRSSIPSISAERPTPRGVKLVPATVGDFVATLELDENGDGSVLHPTLPWTYVVIPKSELGNSCVGDEIAVRVLDGKPKQGKLMGKMAGTVKAVDSFDMHAQFEYEEEEEDDDGDEFGVQHLATSSQERSSHQEDGKMKRSGDDVNSIEESLQTLNAFDPDANPESPSNASSSSFTSRSATTATAIKATTRGASSSSSSSSASDPTQLVPYPVLDRVIPSEVIVLDVGSLSIKVGYANQPVPILSVPTLTGRLLDSLAPQMSMLRDSPTPFAANDLVVGRAAHDRRALLQLSHPFRRGLVSDWSAMKSLLLGALTSLNMDLRRATVVLMESESGNMAENRRNFARILFDDFSLPFVFFARSSTSTLISERRTSGIVVDIGHTTTSIAAVSDGKVIEESRVRFPIAGVDITSKLITLLEDDGYRMFQTEAQRITAEDMKIATAFVRAEIPSSSPSSASFSSSSTTSSTSSRRPQIPYTKPITYRLGDGTELIIADQSWMCTEILFKPTLIGQDIGGIHEHVARVIQTAPNAEVADNIFLVGGTSLLPGLRQRLQSELQHLLPKQQVFVDHPSKAQYSAWIGGALVSRLPDFKDCILSKEEYQAEGPSVIEMTFE